MMQRPNNPAAPTRILFVCVENSCRSQMAEALAKIHGKGALEAYSAGSRPSGRVNPKAIESIEKLGYDLRLHNSKSLSEIPDITYDYAITMGCGDECPQVKASHREEWQIPDPKEFPPERFHEIRDIISHKITELITRL